MEIAAIPNVVTVGLPQHADSLVLISAKINRLFNFEIREFTTSNNKN